MVQTCGVWSVEPLSLEISCIEQETQCWQRLADEEPCVE